MTQPCLVGDLTLLKIILVVLQVQIDGLSLGGSNAGSVVESPRIDQSTKTRRLAERPIPRRDNPPL